MSAPPQAIALNPHTSLLNVYVQIANKMGLKKKERFSDIFRRSQWPRGLRHELSTPGPTLRSWVRIPLEAWMFVCAFILCLPRVEAGKNTSTVIPASRNRRRKGNPVVSGEIVTADLREG
jgi:hypothetical protein